MEVRKAKKLWPGEEMSQRELKSAWDDPVIQKERMENLVLGRQQMNKRIHNVKQIISLSKNRIFTRTATR